MDYSDSATGNTNVNHNAGIGSVAAEIGRIGYGIDDMHDLNRISSQAGVNTSPSNIGVSSTPQPQMLAPLANQSPPHSPFVRPSWWYDPTPGGLEQALWSIGRGINF